MNKLIGTLLSIIVIVISGFLVHRTAVNAMKDIAKNGETSCVRGNLQRIKPIAQCEQYKLKIESIENPNCYSGKTTHSVVVTMQEAKNNGCTID